jgi:guanosine-3',5'-bis(diphosphate) 3'-pyrophosphohydrolase
LARWRKIGRGGSYTLNTGLASFIAAAAFAARKHRDQRRKGADSAPYINHPIAVANVLANEAAVTDPITLSAALLHDTVEDTCTTVEELRIQFGADVALVVAELTDDKSLAKAERKRLQIQHAATVSNRAKLVKLADKICNLRDIAASPPTDWSLERRREYFEWAKQVVDRLRDANPKLASLFDAAYARKP